MSRSPDPSRRRVLAALAALAAAPLGALAQGMSKRPVRIVVPFTPAAAPGNGTHHHFCMELLKLQAGLDIVHVPYKGSAPAENDLIAGVIPTMFLPVHVALPKIKAGQIKVLGESLKERHPLFPDIPSLHEQGVTGYDVDLWIGVWAPPGLPADLLAKYNSEIPGIVAQPEIRDQLASQGLVPNTGTPEQFAKLVEEDFEKWGKVIRDPKIKAG